MIHLTGPNGSDRMPNRHVAGSLFFQQKTHTMRKLLNILLWAWTDTIPHGEIRDICLRYWLRWLWLLAGMLLALVLPGLLLWLLFEVVVG